MSDNKLQDRLEHIIHIGYTINNVSQLCNVQCGHLIVRIT